MLKKITEAIGISENDAYCSLLCAAFGLCPDTDSYARYFSKKYIYSAVSKADASFYRADPYYRKISFDPAVYSYMISEKPDVISITVIEKDPVIISLFRTYILTQFSSKDKIHIVNCDAYDYVENIMTLLDYDYSFVDLWHDTANGLDLYIRFRQLAAKVHSTIFEYWIEQSLLLCLKEMLFESNTEKFTLMSEKELKCTLSFEELRRMALKIKIITQKII